MKVALDLALLPYNNQEPVQAVTSWKAGGCVWVQYLVVILYIIKVCEQSSCVLLLWTYENVLLIIFL